MLVVDSGVARLFRLGGRSERRRRETPRGVQRGFPRGEKFLFVGSLKRYFPHFQASFMII